MKPNLLVLGGTTEATALCRAMADQGLDGVISFAGRVERPVRQPLPQRIGGFGGVDGLARYMCDHKITHLVDATHPFAAQMSMNAVHAARQLDLPMMALTRPPWQADPADRWQTVPDIPAAVAALDRPACTVLLAVGRMHLTAFAPNPQHHYVLRLVDPPKQAIPFAKAEVIVDRGPFTLEADLALMRHHRIDCVVSKNAGGTGAYAKILAARELALPVIMIDRPMLPDRREAHDVNTVLNWVHNGT